MAAVLAYVGAAHRDDGPAQDAVQRVWNDAAWGLLTAIRFQDANPAPVTDGDAGLARLAIDHRPSSRAHCGAFAWYLTKRVFFVSAQRSVGDVGGRAGIKL